MKETIMIVLAMMILLNSTAPFVSAATTQSLEWGVSSEDRFEFQFHYWISENRSL